VRGEKKEERRPGTGWRREDRGEDKVLGDQSFAYLFCASPGTFGEFLTFAEHIVNRLTGCDMASFYDLPGCVS